LTPKSVALNTKTPKSTLNGKTPKSIAFSSNKATAEIETNKLIYQNNEPTKTCTLYPKDITESTKPASLSAREIKERLLTNNS